MSEFPNDMPELDTTRPSRSKGISRKTWRLIWQEPDSFFPEEQPSHISEGQWELLEAHPSGPNRDGILHELELDFAESRAIRHGARIRQQIRDGVLPRNLLAYYGDGSLRRAGEELERYLGPDWRDFINPSPPQNIYDSHRNS